METSPLNEAYYISLNDFSLCLVNENGSDTTQIVDLLEPTAGYTDSVEAHLPLKAVFATTIEKQASDSNPLAKATVYVCMKNGDLYSLCPVIPPFFYLSVQELKDLLRLKNDSHYTSEFIKQIFDSVRYPDGVENAKQLLALEDSTVLTFDLKSDPPSLVGPFPVKESLFSEEIVDFKVIHVNTPKGLVRLVCMLFKQHFALYLLNGECTATWRKQNAVPSMIPLEYVKCSSEPFQLAVDQLYPDLVYICMRKGIYRITLNDWIGAILNGASSKLQGQYLLVTDEQVKSFKVVCDVYSGYSFTAELTNSTVKEQLALRHFSAPVKSVAPDQDTYTAYKIPDLLKPSISFKSKATYGIISESELQQFADAAHVWTGYLVTMMEAIKQQNQRIEAQKQQMLKLSKKLAVFSFDSSRIDAILAKNLELETKFQNLVESIDFQAPLSQFSNQIKAAESELPWFNKRLEQILVLCKDRQVDIDAGNFSDPSKYQENLKMQYDLLVETQRKVEKISRKVALINKFV